MKKAGTALLALGLLCSGPGCVSSTGAALLAQKDPIALVSVVSNYDINWEGEVPLNSTNTGLIRWQRRGRDPDMVTASKADGLINSAETLIRDHLAQSGQIVFADKGAVLGSRAYQEAGLNRHQVSREDVVPAGFRPVDYRDKNLPPALAAETGLGRSMFVEFNFTKAVTSGFGKSGNCRAELEMTVLIVDAGGGTVYKKSFSSASAETIKVSGGVYSNQGLMNLFESAITEACYLFLDDLNAY